MATHFVYPYIIPKNKKFGWELIYSIRSIHKNFVGDFDITVVGDIPEWINHDVINCVELKNNHKYPRVQSRTNEKLLSVANNFKDVVFMHDDYYLIQKCSIDDFKTIKYLEHIRFNGLETKLNRYRTQIRHTYFLLKELKARYDVNFCTHTPFYFETDKLFELHRIFNLTSAGEYTIILENAYYNYFNVPYIHIGDFRAGFWNVSNDKSQIYKAKILNHDERGFLAHQWIYTYLQTLFPDKCSAEIL